ncbi:MAG: response regulator [Proteobacteria bacterium]|nr:response regulator [Pseudomonadota bacterium]
MPKKILAVDDSETMLQLISFALSKEGYSVVTAKDGIDALKMLGKDENFSVIITDINMPNMDGIALIKEIRNLPKCKYTPIIMVTTDSHTDKKAEGKAAGATGWIVKPFQIQQLVAVINKVSPNEHP